MFEGAEAVDYSKPPDLQVPPAGDAADSITLVRNPSWSSATDALRPAHPDRIVLIPVADPDDALRRMRTGEVDLVYNWDPSPSQLGPDTLTDGLHVYTGTLDWSVNVEMNLAVPPLDDVHVRRAINFAIGRADVAGAFRQAGRAAVVSTHIGLDSQEDNLLATFDPFHAATGDLAAAKSEMAQSPYDHDHDGVCDDPACSGIELVGTTFHPGEVEAAHLVAADLEPIGLGVRVKALDPDHYFGLYDGIRAKRLPMIMGNWIKDLTSGSTFFPQLFSSTSGGESMLGASPTELSDWGYEVTSVPNVDEVIDRCLPLGFEAQVRCWAELDQYLMTEVVPWAPLVGFTGARLAGPRVLDMTYDQSPPVPTPALDHVVLKPGQVPEPSLGRPTDVPAIPNGVYRVDITKEDLVRFDPTIDPDGIRENSGTYTIYLRDGTFVVVATADHPLFNPIFTGIYEGTGDQVMFTSQRAIFNAIEQPTERWTFDGTHLRFELASCRDLATLDPENPSLCQGLRTLYEAHPWEKVAD
jgi:hypothetical protein